MRTNLIFVFCCFIYSLGFSQSQGDTIIVEAFNYNSTTRDTVIQFPSNNLSYEKIIMLYNMRCKNNLVSNSANPNQGCGEWDYSCNTYLEDSTRIDSVLAKIKSHSISGYNGDTYEYSLSPVYDYWQFTQQTISIDSIINEDTLQIGNNYNSIPNIISTNENAFKSQFLYEKSEFDTSIFSTIDTLNGISINIVSSNQNAQFLSIKLKLTTDSILDNRYPNTDGFTEVYNMNTFLNNGQNRFNFQEPFVLDSTSNLLVEFSLTNSIANDTSWVECHPITNMALFTNDSKDLFFNEAENIQINNNSLSSISDEITISMWVYGNQNILPKNTSILEGLDSLGNRAINIHLPWSNSNVYWDCGNNGSTYDRISSYTNFSSYSSSWNHWTFTKNSNTGEMKIYLNGNILQSGNAKILPINIETIYLGSNAFESNYWSGKIKELQIFNTELGQDTIRDWMNIRLNNNHPDFSNLIAYYPINEGSGISISDNSGNNISSNISGNPNWTYSRGADLNCFFEKQNFRPNITFYSGNYNLSDTVITVLDSIISPPNLVSEYNVFPVYNSGFNNDTTSLISSNYYWHSNIHDANGDIIGNSPLGPNSSGTINIIDLFYYTRHPMLHQIMSFVTPYGLFLDLGPEGKTWEFDMTDFTPIMNGEKRLIMNAGGQWQEEMDIKFLCIIGTPPRDIIDIKQLWKVQSRNYSDILSDYAFEPKSVYINNNTDLLKVKTMITGHGQEGEFIARQHSLSKDNSTYANWQVWTECSNNPIYPQGGTWPIDRAGWCPGQASDLREDFITNFSPGQTHVFDYSINTGSGDSRYYVSSQLVNYGPPNFQVNAAIKSIISPSLRPDFIRENPICNNPRIEIINYGELTLTSLEIEYEMKGGTTAFFSWNGSLEQLESEIIQLPPFAFDGDENIFNVTILNPNSSIDEQSTNDFLSSKFEDTPNYPNEFRLELQTNNFASENSWIISDMQGNSVLWDFNLNNNQTNLENISLDDGCYVFELFDNGQNGLDFWFTNATTGTGTAKFIQNWPPDPTFPVILNTFEPDFGSSIKHYFTVGNPVFTNSIEIQNHTSRVFPNPSNGQFTIEINPKMLGNVKIIIHNILNEVVLTKNITPEMINYQTNFNLSDLSNGTYFVNIENELISETIKLIISQ